MTLTLSLRKCRKLLLSKPLVHSMLSLDHVPWNFRTQNSRSKNVFSKSFNPKSSWILINPESFPRCRLQRNNKKGTKGKLSAPRILNAQKLKILNARKFLVPETFARGYRKFISKFLWTRTLSIFKIFRDVSCHAVGFWGTDAIEATFENHRKWRQRCNPNPTLWIIQFFSYLMVLDMIGWFSHWWEWRPRDKRDYFTGLLNS